MEGIKAALQSGENPLVALQDLATLLEATSSRAEVLEISSSVPLQLVLGYLQTQDTEQLSVCCAAAEKMLGAVSPAKLCEYKSDIELGLQHPSHLVKGLCLRQLKKHCTIAIVVEKMLLSPTMFHLVTQVIGDADLPCAMLSVQIIEVLAKDTAVLESAVLREGFLLDLSRLMEKNETVRYRVYELVVNISLMSDGNFDFAKASKILDRLVMELEQSDVLVQLNCVELMISLLQSPRGLSYLESQSIALKLHKLLVSAQQDPFGPVVVPGKILHLSLFLSLPLSLFLSLSLSLLIHVYMYTHTMCACHGCVCMCIYVTCLFNFYSLALGIMKFFGHLCHVDGLDTVSLCGQYPKFVTAILNAVQCPEEDTVWGMAVDTLGLLASSKTGRSLLDSMYGSLTRQALRKLGEWISSSSSRLRVRSLEALAMILSCKEESTSAEESDNRKWLGMILPEKPLHVMFVIAKQPFEDLHFAGLRLFQMLAAWEWAQVEMVSVPGLLEYLLDRKTERTKDGKELKYGIVCSLVSSKTAERVFGSPSYLKLRKYEREGPFYVQTEGVVAFEEE